MVALRAAAAALRVSAGRVAAASPRSAAASLVHARSAPAAASLRPWHPGPGPLVGAAPCAGRGWALQPGPAGKRSLSAGGADKDEKSSQEAQGEGEEGGVKEEGDVKKEILERALEHVHTWGWTTQVRKNMDQPGYCLYIPTEGQLPLSSTTKLDFFAKPQPGHEAPALATNHP